MPKKAILSPEQRYTNMRAAQENYRHRVRRFTLQFSLRDTEALEWFDKQPDKGRYLKELVLADKARHTAQLEETSSLGEFDEMEVSEMPVDYNKLLLEKMQAEYDAFIEDTKNQPPDEIIRCSYEAVIKEDLLDFCKHGLLTQTEAKALCRLKNPLDDLYHEWLDKDDNYMDLIRDTVKERAVSAVKEMREAQRESR